MRRTSFRCTLLFHFLGALGFVLLAGLREARGDSPPVEDQQARLKERDRYGDEVRKFQAAGRLDDAVASAEKMLSIERELLGDDSDDVAGSLYTLASLHEQREDFPAARNALQELLATATDRYGPENWHVADARRALDYLDRLEKLSRDDRRLLARADRLMDRVRQLLQAGKYLDALPQAEESVRLRTQVLEEDHWLVGNSLSWLGNVYNALEDSPRAELAYQRAEANLKRSLGENHPYYASTLDNLASVLDDREEFAQAEPLRVRALEIRKQTLGTKHRTYAVSLHNLAFLYRRMKNYDRAKALFQEALEIKRETVGEKTASYADTLDALQAVYWEMHDYAQAEQLMRQVLAIRKETVGESHPDYARALNNLAFVYQDAGDVSQAEARFREAAGILRRALGENHPRYATAVGNLAELYRIVGQYERAEPLYQEQAQLVQKIMGEKHPGYAHVLNQLGLLYADMEQYGKAVASFEKAAEIYRQLNRKDDGELLVTLSNLAQAYGLAGEFSRALPLMHQVVADRKRLGPDRMHRACQEKLLSLLESAAAAAEKREDFVAAATARREAFNLTSELYGKDHWHTLDARLQLAAFERWKGLSSDQRARLRQADDLLPRLVKLDREKRHQEAIPLARQALEIRRDVLGDEDRLTADSLDWLGHLLNESHQYGEAHPVLEQTVAAYKRVVGTKHPAYANSLNRLAFLYSGREKYEQAVNAFREVLAARKAALGSEHADYATTVNDLAGALDNLASMQLKRGDFVKARKSLEEIHDLQAGRWGESHWRATGARLSLAYLDQVEHLKPEDRRRLETADQLLKKAANFQARQQFQESLPLALQAVDLRKEILGNQDRTYAAAMSYVVEAYRKMSDFRSAEPVAREAVALTRKVLGPKHPDYATNLCHLAALYDDMGDYAKAEPLWREVVAIRKELFGENNSTYAAALNDLGINCGKRGDRSQEEFLLRQAVAIHKRVQGARHAEYAVALGNLAVMYESRGEQVRAESLYREASSILQESGGSNDPRYAWTLRSLASLYKNQSKSAAAEPLYCQALGIYAATIGKNHPDYVGTLGDLANLYLGNGEFEKCRPLLVESLEKAKALYGEKNAEYAEFLQPLGWLNAKQGNFAQAEEIFKRSLEIRRQSLGEHHVRYADSLGDLAELYHSTKDYARAEPLYRQALAIKRQALGDKHPDYARILDGAAGVYVDMGDNERALTLRTQALAVYRSAYGEKNPDYAVTLANSALVYENLYNYDKAEELYRQALAIKKAAEGEASWSYSTNLMNLGGVLRQKGNYAAAEPLLRQAVEIRERIRGDKHPQYAQAVYHLGYLYLRKQDYARAEALLNEALSVYQRAFGENHPDCAKCLYGLAELNAGRGEFDKAEPLCRQALEIHRRQLERTAGAESERQQLASASESRHELDMYVSIALRSGGGPTRAYEQVLAWKGSVSSRQGQMRRLRRALQAAGKPEAVKLYDDLAAATARLAALARTAPDPNDPGKLTGQVEETSAEVERLETALARASATFRADQRQETHRTPDEVRAALPAATVLIDLLDYWDFDPRRHNTVDDNWEHSDGSQRRMVAFVIRPDRPQVEAIDLGPSWACGGAIEDWRKTFGRPWSDGRDPADDLRRLLLDRLRPAWKGANLLLISPDAALNRIPWAALPGKEPGSYLIEELAVAIVPAPVRLPEMLAARAPEPANQSLLLVGDVRFDGLPGLAGRDDVSHTAPHTTRGGTALHWAELAGTGAEVDAVKKSFRDSFPKGKITELRRDEATEGAVRREGPPHRYLHFATHGYFAPAQLRSTLATISRGKEQGPGSFFGNRDVAGFHPGLLSGLVLSGANRPVDFDYDDGILTALEVEALDLTEVELTTLSACETGLGESAPAEGLLGLQRAFQAAGAQTVVAGLWQVDDQSTRLLMERFYENLWKRRMPRLEALRQAQLWMLREIPQQGNLARGLEPIAPEAESPSTGRKLPPYYWAAFVLSGDWR